MNYSNNVTLMVSAPSEVAESYLQTIWQQNVVPLAGENELYHIFGNHSEPTLNQPQLKKYTDVLSLRKI